MAFVSVANAAISSRAASLAQQACRRAEASVHHEPIEAARGAATAMVC
jgi:hypothetical protein